MPIFAGNSLNYLGEKTMGPC